MQISRSSLPPRNRRLRGLTALGLLSLGLSLGGLACEPKNKPVIIKGPSVQPVFSVLEFPEQRALRALCLVLLIAPKAQGYQGPRRAKWS